MTRKEVSRRGFIARLGLAALGTTAIATVPGILGSGFTAASAAGSDVDLVVNGSFEDSPTGAAPTGWTTYSPFG